MMDALHAEESARLAEAVGVGSGGYKAETQRTIRREWDRRMRATRPSAAVPPAARAASLEAAARQFGIPIVRRRSAE